ncbi:hypothetical protein ILYODFUR_023140 [Ilyodon furcidens]|uniref:Uncharacterized protein n=1 Tax=Ilyodon furcidens TaxID=33524 RepID=A0ABV0VGT5_9TELE
MPEPPQLAPLDVEEQRLYSEPLPDGRAPHPISKGVPGHPTEEAHFSRLYLGSRSFGHDPKFAFRLSSLFTTTDRHSLPITAAGTPIHLSISCSILPSLMNKTPRYLNSSTGTNLERASDTCTLASNFAVLIFILAASHSAKNRPRSWLEGVSRTPSSVKRRDEIQ